MRGSDHIWRHLRGDPSRRCGRIGTIVADKTFNFDLSPSAEPCGTCGTLRNVWISNVPHLNCCISNHFGRAAERAEPFTLFSYTGDICDLHTRSLISNRGRKGSARSAGSARERPTGCPCRVVRDAIVCTSIHRNRFEGNHFGRTVEPSSRPSGVRERRFPPVSTPRFKVPQRSAGSATFRTRTAHL